MHTECERYVRDMLACNGFLGGVSVFAWSGCVRGFGFVLVGAGFGCGWRRVLRLDVLDCFQCRLSVSETRQKMCRKVC